MRESALWTWLSRARKLVKVLRDLHITRIENLAGVGHPDVEGCYLGSQFWIELKVAPRPKRPSTPLRFQEPLKQSQAEWMWNRWDAGGKVALLVRAGNDDTEDSLYLIPGRLAFEMMLPHTEDWFRLHSYIVDRPTQVEVLEGVCRMNLPGDEE